MTKDSSNFRILVFVPTYNDLELLPEITTAVTALGLAFTALIVDDGSAPPVCRESIDESVLLARLPTNFGLGMATHIAFDHALENNYDALVRIDADGQHPIDEIPKLISVIQAQESPALVVGGRSNRHEGHGPRAMIARFVRNYFTVVARWMSSGRAPEDVNSGFFVADRQTVEILNRTPLERFPEPQLYVLAPRRGIKVVEVALEQRSREHGSSTVTVGRAIMLLYRFSVFVLAELLQPSKSS
jgi:glycosyltransferase involved in cell wall biosynthesis